MDCPNCDTATVRGPVPDAYREFAPEESVGVAACPLCLTVTPCSAPSSTPDWTTVSDALPADERAVGVLLLVGLLDSLATNRAAIESLLATLEGDGVDAFATIDRLAADRTLDPTVALERRRHQLEQLL